MTVSNIDIFLQKYGFPLSQLIPGKKEIALNRDNAKKFLELLQAERIEVLGGDVLVRVNKSIGYCHQVWGSKYHFLSWSDEDECDGGYGLAIKHIEQAYTLSKSLGGEVFFSFVY